MLLHSALWSQTWREAWVKYPFVKHKRDWKKLTPFDMAFLLITCSLSSSRSFSRYARSGRMERRCRWHAWISIKVSRAGHGVPASTISRRSPLIGWTSEEHRRTRNSTQCKRRNQEQSIFRLKACTMIHAIQALCVHNLSHQQQTKKLRLRHLIA